MDFGHPLGKEEFEDSLYGHRISEWQHVRPLAQGIVYYDPVTKIAYSHTDYLPESLRGRLRQKHAFESHSQRAFFIIENNKLTEYKGLTWPYSDEIVPASGQPRGLLLKQYGERETRALNDIAKRGGNVKAEYHNAGVALLRRESPSKIEVKPLAAGEEKKHEKGSDGDIIHYGVLKRWGDDYIPFIRLDLFQIVHQLARMEGIGYIKLLSNALERLGRVLRTSHELGIYHCFTHPGNVDAHGNLIDYEHAIYRDEIAAIQEKIKTKTWSEYAKLFGEECLRFRDIDVFFGGEREILRKCQECFKLTYNELMTKVRFLRENISLSVGIPVFELLAHLNIGFYEDTVKKLHSKDQRRIIEAFIDAYCPMNKRGMIKKEVFFTLAREGEWTEEVSGFIANPARQIPSEFILDLWKQPPLKGKV